MFDINLKEAYIKCKPINDTEKLTKLFYHMSEEIWPDLKFGDRTYLNVYMRRAQSQMNKRDIYNGIRGFDKKNEDDWLDYVDEYQYETGVLYYVKLRHQNARIEPDQHLNIYCFVHNDLESLSKEYCNEIDAVLPKLRKNFWFSYMEHDCRFIWHTDGDTGFRYHHVLNNDGEGITSSIETSGGSVFCKPGEAFILNTSKPHSVIPSKSVRLHAVASMSGPDSINIGHNNQWMEDNDVTWSEWSKQHGYKHETNSYNN